VEGESGNARYTSQTGTGRSIFPPHRLHRPQRKRSPPLALQEKTFTTEKHRHRRHQIFDSIERRNGSGILCQDVRDCDNSIAAPACLGYKLRSTKINNNDFSQIFKTLNCRT